MNPPDLAVSAVSPRNLAPTATAVSPAVRVIRHGPPMTTNTATTTTPAAAPLAPRPTATERRRTTPMLVQLDREWDRLRRRATAIRTVRGWDGDTTFRDAVQTVSDLDELVAATQPHVGPPGSGDAILRRLVELAATDELAGRIVLQRLLPGLISQSRRWMQPGSGTDASDIAIGAGWMAIRGFDVRARSRHVAPALVADALWIGFRRSARRRVASEVPVPSSVLGTQPAPAHVADPIIALAGTLRAAARAGVRSSDLDLLRTIVVSGGPTRAARDCEVTVRTIRNRRDHAAARVRRALGPEWADWTDPLVAA